VFRFGARCSCFHIGPSSRQVAALFDKAATQTAEHFQIINPGIPDGHSNPTFTCASSVIYTEGTVALTHTTRLTTRQPTVFSVVAPLRPKLTLILRCNVSAGFSLQAWADA
jgi:hypothetical protein